MSVADLLNERNSNPTLVNNNDVFKIAENSIGLETISKYAQTIVNSLGTTKESQEYIVNKKDALSGQKLIEEQVALGNTPSDSVIKGFEILKQVSDSPTEYSKVKRSDSNQKVHAIRAVNYIWSTLDVNSQNKLKAQAGLSGQKPTDLLMDLIIISDGSTSESSVLPISDSITNSGSAADSELKGRPSMTTLQTFLKGTHAIPGQTYVHNDPELGLKFNATITGSLPFVSPEGEELGPTTLYGMLQSK